MFRCVRLFFFNKKKVVGVESQRVPILVGRRVSRERELVDGFCNSKTTGERRSFACGLE
jgi:hypothetical protein